jgi:hypothetical protein
MKVQALAWIKILAFGDAQNMRGTKGASATHREKSPFLPCTQSFGKVLAKILEM